MCEKTNNIKTKNSNVLFFPLLEGWRYGNTGEIQAESQAVLDSITEWSFKDISSIGTRAGPND
jgi:hypothetical protein